MARVAPAVPDTTYQFYIRVQYWRWVDRREEGAAEPKWVQELCPLPTGMTLRLYDHDPTIFNPDDFLAAGITLGIEPGITYAQFTTDDKNLDIYFVLDTAERYIDMETNTLMDSPPGSPDPLKHLKLPKEIDSREHRDDIADAPGLLSGFSGHRKGSLGAPWTFTFSIGTEFWLAPRYFNPITNKNELLPPGVPLRLVKSRAVLKDKTLAEGVTAEGPTLIRVNDDVDSGDEIYFVLEPDKPFVALTTNELMDSNPTNPAPEPFVWLPSEISTEDKTGGSREYDGTNGGTQSDPWEVQLEDIKIFAALTYFKSTKPGETQLPFPAGVWVFAYDYDTLSKNDLQAVSCVLAGGSIYLPIFVKDETKPDLYFGIPVAKSNPLYIRSDGTCGSTPDQPADSQLPLYEEWTTRKRFSRDGQEGLLENFTATQKGSSAHPWAFDYYPRTFDLETPCTILGANGGRAKITASAQDAPSLQYAWSTTSSRLTLSAATGLTVDAIVNAGASASSAKGEEEVIVQLRENGRTLAEKTLQLTVVRVKFGRPAPAHLTYGYDDMGTPASPDTHHISVMNGQSTSIGVTIEGGALGNELEFECVHPTICEPAAALPAAATFDLQLNAKNKKKATTELHAKCKCSASPVLGRTNVNVYKELLANVQVGKFQDSASHGTTIVHGGTMFASFQARINRDSYRQAVARIQLTDFNGGVVNNVHFDTAGLGALEFDINAGNGGAALNLISAAMAVPPGVIRVALVRRMRSFYYLNKAVTGHVDHVLEVRGARTWFNPGDTTTLGVLGPNPEPIAVASVLNNTITLTGPVSHAHPVGARIEFPAAGWSSNPIVVVEENGHLDWVTAHEVGHRAFAVMDLTDPNNLMHFQSGNPQHGLYFRDMRQHYPPHNMESQWELISRT